MRIDVPDEAVLRGRLDWIDLDGNGRVWAVLEIGDFELARWEVTDRRSEFEGGEGDYLTPIEREQREQRFVSRFVGERLAPIFAGLGERS